MTNTTTLFAALLLTMITGHALAGVVVIAHPDVRQIDSNTTQKIFTGKVIKVGGVNVTPVNLKPGKLRDQFMREIMDSTDEKYIAYWTVRRYIGKGTPPKEVDDTASMIEFVRTTPGAIGYIDEQDVTTDLNVIMR